MEALEVHRGLVFLVLCFIHSAMLYQASKKRWMNNWLNLLAGLAGFGSTAWFIIHYYEPALENPALNLSMFIMYTFLASGLLLATVSPIAMIFTPDEEL